MSIYKINQSLPITRKFELLNDMIVELFGELSQSNYNVNEITSLYLNNTLSLNRQHNRNVPLGHTLATYANWTPVKDETGYSIWKYPITSYTHVSTNEVYLDGGVLTNRGLAYSETATAFTYVSTYDGLVYTDVTTECFTETGTAFSVLGDTSSYIYIGNSTSFAGFKVELYQRGSNVTPTYEYYNGSAWTPLVVSDNTNSMKSDGYVNWTVPVDFSQTTVDGTTAYFVRVGTSTVPSIVPEIYYLIPYSSVVGLLALSSAQILNQEWAWCYYNGYIYVTLRNTGNPSYLGDFYITSSANNTYKQNYFIYNHFIKINHKNTTPITPFTSSESALEKELPQVTEGIYYVDTAFEIVNIVVVSINGLVQVEGIDYTVDGTRINFNSNLLATDVVYVVYYH